MKRLFLLLLLSVSTLWIPVEQVYCQVIVPVGQVEDPASRDAFGRLRVSEPVAVFDAQFTYDRQPLLFDTITVGSGTAVSHQSTDRNVNLSFTSSPSGSTVGMQSFEFFRYQPGKSQLVFITFNMNDGSAGVVKFAGYSDGDNGIEYRLDNFTQKLVLLSNTGNGDQEVSRASWNLDAMDGSGASGLTIDTTRTQILVIDFQALYVGKVRVGFDIDGVVYYVHEFKHANLASSPYIQTANLPIRVGMTSTATVTADMDFICSSVISEGGSTLTYGYSFAASGTVSAGNGTDTHILSIQPASTFNSFTNRTKIIPTGIEITVTGANPIQWKLCLGQALTGVSTTAVNSTYSATETVSGTLSGTPAIVLESGYVGATSQSKSQVSYNTTIRLPITLDHEGLDRDLGRLTLLVQGLGGASTTYATVNFIEIR